MWVNRTDRYPYTSPEVWRTRGWLNVRKVLGTGVPTAHDRRVAMLLLGHPHASRASHAPLRGLLEEIAYGDDNAAAKLTARIRSQA